MISIFDPRYWSDGKLRGGAKASPSEAIIGLVSGMLQSISRYVLTGDNRAPLREEIDRVTESLFHAESVDQILAAESAVSGVLARYRRDAQQAATAQTIEVQHIFAILNHALIVMAEGSDRSVSRLNQVQVALQHASGLRDIFAMKAALSETVQFVEKEASESRKLVTEELARLQTEVGKAREFIGNTGASLPGRAEGITTIARNMQSVVEGQSLYALAYSCERLPAITQRYGAQVTEELIFRVIRERLQPIAGTGEVFRWTSPGLVAVFTRKRDLPAVTREVTALNCGPVEHRVSLGNRTAVLRMAPSCLVLEGAERTSEQLVEQLDHFMGVRG
jgi:hypothetical protein